MYRFLLIFALLPVGNAFCQEKPIRYSITGQLTNLKGRTVYLYRATLSPEVDPATLIIDSTVSADGHFSLQGYLAEAGEFRLGLKGEKPERSLPFLLDNEPVSIIGDADSLARASLQGSKTVREQKVLLLLLTDQENRKRKLEQLIGEAIQRNDTIASLSLGHEYQRLGLTIADLKTDFIRTHPGSLVSLFAFSGILPVLPREKARALWNTLEYNLQQHSVGRKIREQVFDQSDDPGQYMPNLILVNPQNQPVSLLEFKNQVILIDFWASGCNHCRQEHNRLKALYQKYRNQGFKIISVSVDSDLKAWRKALRKANLPWTQLSDRVGNQNVIGTQYGNGSLPINLLIDKKGYIIRKGLHGDELAKQLAIVFSKP